MSEPILEKYTFVHAIKADAIVELNGARRAILPVFKMGKTALQDKRSFVMDESDFSTLKTNLANKKTPCSLLYEHGSGPRGGISGGKVISLQEKAGEIFAHATLTKRAYEECKDEEWLSCSGGFLASRDPEGNIRPVEMLEVSFTNFPAFPGLGAITTFAVLTEAQKELSMAENKGTEKPVEVTPTPPVVADEVKLESTNTAAGVPVTTTETKEPVKLDTTVTVVAVDDDGAADPADAEDECPCPNCPCAGCACCPPVAAGLESKPEDKEELRDFNTKQRANMADKGQAMPDGSFPIATGKDLENAIQSVGRAKDPAAAKAHIRTRAKALGMTDKLPTDFETEEQVVELSAEQTENVIEMVATTRFDEKVRKDKVVMLMALGKADGKRIQ